MIFMEVLPKCTIINALRFIPQWKLTQTLKTLKALSTSFY